MKQALIIILSLSCFYIKAQIPSSTTDKINYWEYQSNETFNFPNKSIIEFDDKKIHIFDRPMDSAGLLNYTFGTYKFDSSKFEMTIKVKKAITISLNTGSIVWYTKISKTYLKLKFDNTGKLLREQIINRKGELITSKLHYNEISSKELPFSTKWIKDSMNPKNKKSLRLAKKRYRKLKSRS